MRYLYTVLVLAYLICAVSCTDDSLTDSPKASTNALFFYQIDSGFLEVDSMIITESSDSSGTVTKDTTTEQTSIYSALAEVKLPFTLIIDGKTAATIEVWQRYLPGACTDVVPGCFLLKDLTEAVEWVAIGKDSSYVYSGTISPSVVEDCRLVPIR